MNFGTKEMDEIKNISDQFRIAASAQVKSISVTSIFNDKSFIFTYFTNFKMKKQNFLKIFAILISLNTLNAMVLSKNLPRHGTHWNRIGKRFGATQDLSTDSMDINADDSDLLLCKITCF
ncbi:hypothetical protein BpHYR1_044360 [Brachionus plicatilis]|uniref:Uncharacterized protein n=1 Tax=Brachionus plicatilis TaxID=10195 RepID=A0A3M7SSR8_BRAPC|nr:hypothetical protein BpHYR1_044360 [Brachionus plicatilis]